jgi:transposase
MIFPVTASNEVFMDDTDATKRAAHAKKGSPFLNTEQAAFYLGLCPRRLQALRSCGDGPRFRRHSRYVRYHIDDLDIWSRNTVKGADHA